MDKRSDLELLRAYEPLLAYTDGELFFPSDVESYVAACSLWRTAEDGTEAEVVPAGQLDLARLAGAAREWPGCDLHLRFVPEATLRQDAKRQRGQRRRRAISRSGRLAAVGMLGRIVDLLMRVSLLIRGAVPGGLAAAAATRYRELPGRKDYTYYGRVTRDGGYIALQYWFFYAMNDWRSTFGGVNDHEADWEKVVVYLQETPDGPAEPMWLGASSHEYTGDDLRRSWHDPDLHREGDHPVVYPGAGSHSNQVQPGDYLIQVDPAFLRGAVRLWRHVVAWLMRSARLVAPRRGIGVPFVDYARGDGIRVGPGTGNEWQPVVIDDAVDWVAGYRGLWGRDTRDWFDGERAPSGPRYERDGTVRRSWIDPLSWVGLHKVPPGDEAARDYLREYVADLDARLERMDADIHSRREELRRLSTAATALGHNAHTRRRAKRYRRLIEADEAELTARSTERALLDQERSNLRRALDDGVPLTETPHGHLQAPHRPYASGAQRPTRLVHIWAALSTALLLFALGALLFVPVPEPLWTALGVVLAFAAVDAVARGRFRTFMVGLMAIGVVVALVAGLIWALIADWRLTLLIPVTVTAVVLLVLNLRDLMRG